jgi:hypothetical protein
MSLVLSWENPAGLFDQGVNSVLVTRTTPNGTTVNVTTDGTWGMELDEGNDDVSAVYDVMYLGPTGNTVVHLTTQDIERWPRPSKSCAIRWDMIRQDGSPDANRIIGISDRHNTGNFVRFITTNQAGKALFIAMYGARLTYHLEGDLYELDAVTPSLREITWPDFVAYGSQLISDHRAWF